MILTKYYSCVQIEKNEMGGTYSMYGDMVLAGRLEGKIPLGRPRHRWIFRK